MEIKTGLEQKAKLFSNLSMADPTVAYWMWHWNEEPI
jgi:hypothetical protein